MIEFKPRTKCPDSRNKAYVQINHGGMNRCILGNPEGRVYEWSVLPNCTGYVHGRVIETIGTDEGICRGNAENYWDYKDGFPRGQIPKVGAIACWRKGKSGYSKDGAGHVMFVEKVTNPNMDFDATDSAYYGSDDKGIIFRKRHMKRVNGTYALGKNYYFQGFIYIFDPVKIHAVNNAVYRLYNPNGKLHFFTYNVGEANSLSRGGWIYEGVAWYAPKKGIPVYRLYNPNTGDHLFTTNEREKEKLQALGWKYECVAFYSDEAKSVPVYRLYNPNSGEHFYTANKAEKDELVRRNWKYEGIAFYGIK